MLPLCNSKILSFSSNLQQKGSSLFATPKSFFPSNLQQKGSSLFATPKSFSPSNLQQKACSPMRPTKRHSYRKQANFDPTAIDKNAFKKNGLKDLIEVQFCLKMFFHIIPTLAGSDKNKIGRKSLNYKKI